MRQRGFTLLIYAVIVLAVLGTLSAIVYGIYHKGEEAGRAEVQAKWDADKEATRQREAKASATAAAALAAERAKRRIVTKEVVRNVDREVAKIEYRDRCLPDTGVCLANAAISGTVPAGCFSDGTVPGTKPAG